MDDMVEIYGFRTYSGMIMDKIYDEMNLIYEDRDYDEDSIGDGNLFRCFTDNGAHCTGMFDGKKERLIYRHFKDKEGVDHYERYSHSGKLVEEILRYRGNGLDERIEVYDGKSNLLLQMSQMGDRRRREVRDGNGKLLEERRQVGGRTINKVYRKGIAALLGKAKTTVEYYDKDRVVVNSKIRKILKNDSLTFAIRVPESPP